MSEGWHGWDDYAPFYDWENARTVARRDLAFWRGLARQQAGTVLELGCGTGRLALPLMKSGVRLVGIDRSEAMLNRARAKARRAGLADRVRFVRADIRRLPFRTRPGFGLVMAPYGMLQSLTSERDLAATLGSVARVIRRDGLFGIDLVPDLPRWSEYKKRVTLSGSRDARTHLTLRETVRQDTRRRLTMFDQEYAERRDGETRMHRFALTFRTLSVPQMRRRLEKAGFRVRAVLGDYQGGPWHPDADVWIICRLPDTASTRMTIVTPTTFVQPSADVIFRELEAESVLLNLVSGHYFGLNPVGTRVWQLIETGATAGSVADAIAAEFDGDRAEIARDVVELLTELAARKLVVHGSAPAPPPR